MKRKESVQFGICVVVATMVFALPCCGGDDSVTEDPKDSTAVLSDSVLALMAYNDSMRVSLFERVELSGRTELMIDSLYLDTLEDGPPENALTGDDVRFLGMNLIDGHLSAWNSYYIDEFLRFDTMRMNGELETYLENPDLGMTVHCDGMVLEKFSVNDSTDLLIWLIDYHTYEACPYGWGTTCFASVFINGDLRNTAVAGNLGGGADPPVWGDHLVTSQWKDGILLISELNRNCDGEVDENENEIVTTEIFSHEISIVDGMLKETKSDWK